MTPEDAGIAQTTQPLPADARRLGWLTMTDQLPPPVPLEDEPELESWVYVPVLYSTKGQWRTRVSAIVGLILLVVAAALIVALGIYQLGHALNQIMQGYLSE
jgi:hypothetical protein